MIQTEEVSLLYNTPVQNQTAKGVPLSITINN